MQRLHMQTEALVYLKIWNTENQFTSNLFADQKADISQVFTFLGII